MKKVLIILLMMILSVGCSDDGVVEEKSIQSTSQSTAEDTLQIETVEGYWECKGEDESILFKFDWKNNLDLYYSDGSREECSYSIVESKTKSIDIDIKNGDTTTAATIKTDDNGETITLEKSGEEYYFIRIPKDEFYIKLVQDYKQN